MSCSLVCWPHVSFSACVSRVCQRLSTIAACPSNPNRGGSPTTAARSVVVMVAYFLSVVMAVGGGGGAVFFVVCRRC